MEHFYKEIHGWFNFQNVYTGAVEDVKIPKELPALPGWRMQAVAARFVEVGCWLGQSSVYMAVEIINSGKYIKFDCIDAWEYLGEEVDGISEDHHKKGYGYPRNNLYESFLKNIDPVKETINPIRMHSDEAVKAYEDESLDFIYIDATHDYENVKKDIGLWYPKLKKNGTIAGHDANLPEVKKAVSEFFEEEPNSEGNLKIRTHWKSWRYQKLISQQTVPR